MDRCDGTRRTRAMVKACEGISTEALEAGVLSKSTLERILRPIVEGQLRHYLHDHPELLDNPSLKGNSSKQLQNTIVNGAAKRILGDLLCSETRVRLVQALVPMSSATPD